MPLRPVPPAGPAPGGVGGDRALCGEAGPGDPRGDDAPQGPDADVAFMELALDQARAAAEAGEVPIGAVVVREGAVIGRGHNQTRRRGDPTAHAEMLALAEALLARGEMRLPGATVYTTVEPCFMCAGALSHARVARVVWAVRDPKFGGCASLGAVLSDPRLNHRAALREGVLADSARALLVGFFRSVRAGAAPVARLRRTERCQSG